MKQSTAIKKLNRIKNSCMYYAERALTNPAESKKAVNQIKQLKNYARQLILRKQLDARPWRQLFFDHEFTTIQHKLNQNTKTNGYQLFD